MNVNKEKSMPKKILTKEELWNLKASDLARLNLTDEQKSQLREINILKQKEILDRSERLKSEERPLVEDLVKIGLKIESVWDLVNSSEKYPKAIPILLRHLLFPYSDRIREGIARALAMPEDEVKQAWPIIVREYRNAPMGRGLIARGDTRELKLGAKDGLACALAAAVTDETLDEYIKIVKDSAHGESRVLLLSALRKSKNPKANTALEELVNDIQLRREIISWLKR